MRRTRGQTKGREKGKRGRAGESDLDRIRFQNSAGQIEFGQKCDNCGDRRERNRRRDGLKSARVQVQTARTNDSREICYSQNRRPDPSGRWIEPQMYQVCGRRRRRRGLFLDVSQRGGRRARERPDEGRPTSRHSWGLPEVTPPTNFFRSTSSTSSFEISDVVASSAEHRLSRCSWELVP